MENATKGLMIAGAILIAIVLIGIGVFLVSQATGFLDIGKKQFSDLEVSAFNSQFVQYEGKKTGTDVRDLLSRINTNNLNGIDEGTILETGINVNFEVSSAQKPANIVADDSYTSTTYTAARQKISTSKTYYIAIGYNNKSKFVNEIGISDVSLDAATELLTGRTN